MQHGSILIETKTKPGRDTLKKLTKLANFNFENNNPDFLHLSMAGKTSITIKQIRELILWANKHPFNHEHKVAVVWPAEKMTPEAQNSLLKTLEEPANNTLIILATRNRKKLLPTILSRVVQHNATNIWPDENAESDLLTANKLAVKFAEGSYSSRRKIIKSELQKLDRAELSGFIQSLLKELTNNYLKYQEPIQKNKSLQKCKQALQANQSSVNTKLILENLLYI